MKPAWTRFAYPVTYCALLVCVALQVIWLRQLFAAQTALVRSELEHEVSEAAKTTIYNSLTEKNKKVEQFFMSDEWAQLRQAFDNMKINDVSNVFNYGIDADSGFVEIKFSFRNSAPTAAPHSTRSARPPAPAPQAVDQASVRRMQQEVDRRLRTLGLSGPHYYVLYTYADERAAASTLPTGAALIPDYASRIYSFNLKHAHKYQALVPNIAGVVWYRMRYYLLSSAGMILLTGAAFLFILSLLRKQRLYTEAKISFINNMTHELKTPLSTVAVALESIVKYHLEREPEKLASYVSMSQAELHKLTRMIEKVLTVNTQLEGSAPRAEYELLDVQELVRGVLDSLQVRLFAEGTSVSWQGAAEPCFVYGHQGHLASVFYNLFDNALKYCTPLARLAVSFRRANGWVHITVTDSGPGIEAIYQDKVFDRFFRIPGAGFIHNVRGSGLGLHFVKQTMGEHGGSIRLTSQPGRGTTFHLKLRSADEDIIR